MMLTTKARYAVTAVIELAEAPKGSVVKLQDISTKHDIPVQYLEQIFIKLKNAKIVKSIRGPGGGYVINNSLESLIILDIIDAVDENIEMTRCSKCKSYVSGKKRCKTHKLWTNFTTQIRNYFKNISIADILDTSY